MLPLLNEAHFLELINHEIVYRHPSSYVAL